MSDFKTMDVRIIATLQEIGYVFEAVRIVFEPTRSRITHTNLPRSKELIAIHTKWNVARTPEILEMLKKGGVEVEGTLIHVKRRASVDKWIPLDSMYHRNYDKDSAQTRFGLGTYCIALEASDSISPDPAHRAKLDNFLRSQRTPWDGMDDLRRMFAKQSRTWTQGTSYVEVIAPIGVRFGSRSLIGNQRLEFGVRTMPCADASQISIACLTQSKGEIIRKRRRLSPRFVKTHPTHRRFVFHLPEQYEWGKCILMYRGREVDRFAIPGTDSRLSNPKWRVFSEITGGIEPLMTLPSGKPLEAHLEILLHLLGFHTAHYGMKEWPGDKSTPDIVAFPSRGDWFIVLECTSRDADTKDKLGKLSTRCKELSAIADGIKVYPVIFTSLRREVITKSDLAKASKEGISLVTSDDLPELLDAAQSMLNDEEVLAIFQRFVPSDL